MEERIVNNNLVRSFIHTAEEWLQMDMTADEKNVVLGAPENPLIRTKTKNLIEAPEKSFKTTFAMRLAMGMSCGTTVYEALPVRTARRILYLHGELSNPEIQERTRAAVKGLTGPFVQIVQGKALEAHLVNTTGQNVLQALIDQYKPDDVVFDPWQSFISGCDENSFKDISLAMKFCDNLIERFGVTLWIPIHLGKNHDRGARGHSSINGWRDTAIRLKKEGQMLQVKVEPRWAKCPPPFQLRFADGTLLDEAGQIVFAGQNAQVRSLVESAGGKLSKDEIAELLGKKKDAARKAIKRATEAGAINCDGEYCVLPVGPELRVTP